MFLVLVSVLVLEFRWWCVVLCCAVLCCVNSPLVCVGAVSYPACCHAQPKASRRTKDLKSKPLSVFASKQGVRFGFFVSPVPLPCLEHVCLTLPYLPGLLCGVRTTEIQCEEGNIGCPSAWNV